MIKFWSCYLLLPAGIAKARSFWCGPLRVYGSNKTWLMNINLFCFDVLLDVLCYEKLFSRCGAKKSSNDRWMLSILWYGGPGWKIWKTSSGWAGPSSAPAGLSLLSLMHYNQFIQINLMTDAVIMRFRWTVTWLDKKIIQKC